MEAHSCLSSEPHDWVRDHLLHYLGCLEFHEREEYKARLETQGNDQSELITKELRRIKRLRQVIFNDEKRRNHVTHLEDALKKWRASSSYENGLQDVQTWRRQYLKREKSGNQNWDSITLNNTSPHYNPNEDLNAYLIQYRNMKPDKNLNFRGHFPDQKTSIHELLDASEGTNSLSKEHVEEKQGTIRYFHLPLNNMHWVEQAISRYFNEDHRRSSTNTTNTSEGKLPRSRTLLRPEFWSGQQHGGRDGFVHTRHLRPLCETVSSDLESMERFPKNIVLFMPYLHWDTDRRREKMAQLVNGETERNRRIGKNEQLSQKELRRKLRESLKRPNGLSGRGLKSVSTELPIPEGYATVAKTATEVFKVAMEKYKRPSNKPRPGTIDKDGKIVTGNALGKVLFSAAMLYEEMTMYRDERLFEKYLHPAGESPLHPRRTLDQAYYWTLPSTKMRDRDQVVYRGTTSRTEEPHKYDVNTGKWSCDGIEFTLGETSERCDQCHNEITQVSQLVMVDQLWMWILDEHTIITSFPKRYGINKHAEAGVHKSIRKRLAGPKRNQIRSVFDLALLIIDECSNTFFDRTKTDERHPQVLVKFSEAIGRIAHKQSVAFQHLWGWTDTFAKQSRQSKTIFDIQHFVAPLLNINPEGKLQREIKDVIDELDIMIHITKKQKEVIKKFKKNAEKILNPEDKFKRGSSNFHDDEDKEKRENFVWFNHSAEDQLAEIEDRLEELEGLKKTAETTSSSLDHLLGLKQQQASVIQAWQSVRQSEQAVMQGRAIMIFTVFTIIFLPLSFMSSVWGMNNQQWQTDAMDLWLEIKLMIGVTVGVLVFTLPLALSSFVREGISATWNICFNWFITCSGIYEIYLDMGFDTCTIAKTANDMVRQMKRNVQSKRQKKRRDRRDQERAIQDALEETAKNNKNNGGNSQTQGLDKMSGTNGVLCTHSAMETQHARKQHRMWRRIRTRLRFVNPRTEGRAGKDVELQTSSQ